MNQELEKIIEQLDNLIGSTQGRPIIEYQTGPDESVVVGSEKEILALEKSLIESVVSSEDEEFGGVQLKSSNNVAGVLDPIGGVALDWVLITKTEDDKKEVTKRINT